MNDETQNDAQVCPAPAAVPATPAPAPKKGPGRPHVIDPKTGLEFKQTRAERERDAARKRARRAEKLKAQEAIESTNWNYPEALKEDAAKQMLRDSLQTKSTNVINQCWEFGRHTAHESGLVENQYLWSEGALKAYQCSIGATPTDPGEVPVPGAEVLTARELYMLWSFATAGRKVCGQQVTFPEWLALRKRFRTDLYWACVDVLAVPLNESVHRIITDDFYPRFDSVEYPSYTLQTEHRLMAGISETREFLLLDPRGYMKTAIAGPFVIQFFTNFPDARVFDSSGTDDLAEGFMRIVKAILIKEPGAEPSDFQMLFPEYTIHGGNVESPNPFVLPCRKFKQKDFSLWTAGVMSASSGAHCDLWIRDDVVQSAGSEDTRTSLRNKIANLSNVPDVHACRISLGTRYHEEDAYSDFISLLDENPEAIKYLCRGVWTVKPEYRKVAVEQLTVDMVDLLWPDKSGSPERTFADLRQKLILNKKDFMHQQLNDPWDEENSDQTPEFEANMITAHIIPGSAVPKDGEDFLVCDVAYSVSIQSSDLSVLLVGRIATHPDSKRKSLYVLHVDAKRRTQSQLALDMALTAQRFNPKLIILEQLAQHELLIAAARTHATRNAFSLPQVYPSPISHEKDSKMKKIKGLQILFDQDRLWINEDAGMIPLLMDQFTRYNGKKSSRTRKDDIPDAIAILAQHALPIDDRSEKERAALQEFEKKARDQQHRVAINQMIFGTAPVRHTPTAQPEQTGSSYTDLPGGWKIPMGFRRTGALPNVPENRSRWTGKKL